MEGNLGPVLSTPILKKYSSDASYYLPKSLVAVTEDQYRNNNFAIERDPEPFSTTSHSHNLFP